MAKSKKLERKADQIAEIKKCGIDPIYFIKTYVKISHPTRGPIAFETYPFQEDCVRDFLNHRRIICNKSRQLGLSTVSAAYALWLALFRRNKNIIILATRLDTAKLFLEKVKGMFESLPEWLVMPELITLSVREMKFSNKSIIKALPCTENAARGEAISLLVVDEAAHIEEFDQVWMGLSPTLSTGGDVILISSPNGVGNQFYNIWQKATDNPGQEGSNGFYGLFLPYHVHPEHDQKWFDEQCASLQGSPRAIAQELLASFEASGHSYLDSDTLNRIAGKIETPIARFGANLDMVIWKYAAENHRYILSGDVARGDADDYSAFHVIDATQEEVVAEYRGRMQPDRFAEFMVEVAMKYNDAFIVHEMNAAGLTTSYKLKELKYKHLYYEKLFTNDLFKVFTPIEIGELIPGFTTSVKTRPIMLSKLEAALRNNRLKCKSDRLVNEFRTFVVDNNKPKAQKNCHDDLVMALAIGVNFMEYVWNNAPKEENYAWAMLAGMSRTSSTLAELQRKHQRNSVGGWGIAGNDMPSKSGWATTQKPANKDENADFHRSFDWLLKP